MIQLNGRKPEVSGVTVHALATQTEVAEWNSLSTRQVRNLEAKGLPTYSRGGRKYYPLPHEVIWYSEYLAELRQRGRVSFLSFEEAYARDRAFVARLEGGQLGNTRPDRAGEVENACA